MRSLGILIGFSLIGLGQLACRDDNRDYAFNSRFEDGMSSVSYGGQLSRWMLLEELNREVGALDPAAVNGPEDGAAVVDLLTYFFDYSKESVGGDGSDTLNICPADRTCVQSTYGDMGSVTNLDDKLPENDIGWTNTVKGYGTDLTTREVVDDLIQRIADNYHAEKVDGVTRQNALGDNITKVYIDEDGVDLKQMLQKFIMGAVMYSQGTSDYLRLNEDGKGLESDNTEAVVKNGSTKAYTGLEHVWDEAFGYFGGSRFMSEFTVDEIADIGGRDTHSDGSFDKNGDGDIDLTSERNQGFSQTAAKRDRAISPTDMQTTLAQNIFADFHAGRTLITETADALDENQKTELLEHRNRLVNNWERGIGATIVHYLNDTIQDLVADEYSFVDHAKHWSEAVGYATQLQFNTTKLTQDSTIDVIFVALGSTPTIPGVASQADLDAHLDTLRAARGTLLTDLGLDASFEGNANGQGGF